MYICLQECIFSWKHAKKCRATLFKRGCVSVLGRVQLPGSQGLFIMEQSRVCGVSVHKLQQGLPGFECPSAHSLAGAKCTSVPPLLPRPRSPSSGAEPLGHTRFSTRGGCSSSAASGLCSPAAGTTCSGLSITTAVPRDARPHPGSLLINSCHPTEHPSHHGCLAGAGQQWWQSPLFLTWLVVSHPASAMVLLLLPLSQRSFPLFTLPPISPPPSASPVCFGCTQPVLSPCLSAQDLLECLDIPGTSSSPTSLHFWIPCIP